MAYQCGGSAHSRRSKRKGKRHTRRALKAKKHYHGKKSCWKHHSKKRRVHHRQRGAGTLMPPQYYGGTSPFYDPGSPELQLAPGAYGPNQAVSHGVLINTPSGQMIGPDLAPAPFSNMATG